jgi:hydrogenase expression/formation protein HypE
LQKISGEMDYKSFLIQAVLFDFDGTLTKPGALDFSVIKTAIKCPDDQSVLEFIESLPIAEAKVEARSILERFEMEAAANSEPNDGAEDLIRYLLSKNIPIGIISRNSLESIERALLNFTGIRRSDFGVIISRDESVKYKPSGDGILLAARRLNVKAEDLLVVGDNVFDMHAGRNAKAVTVFLNNRPESRSATVDSDHTISHLEGLKKIVRLGLPLRAGKFPNDLLKKFFDQVSFDDPSMLIAPGIGEDTAAVSVEKDETMVLTTDPITFVTDSIGNYAVVINANDIATAGADPRWLLATFLFPSGVSASAVLKVLHELESVCRRKGIALCGGHTELTDAVKRPVVTGMLAGTVDRRNLKDKRNMRPGERILFTKAVAVEGTAIIAREFGSRLEERGMSEAEIEECKQMLSLISIMEEAGIAGRCKGVSAMHDVTEGGLATALEELSISGHHRIRIHTDRIPFFSQTKKVCRLLNIDPIGMIGSGSLLICCGEEDCEDLMKEIRQAGTDVTCIGKVLEEGQGIEAVKQGVPVDWPRFEVDEITRLY